MENKEKFKNLIGKPQVVDIPTKELFDVLSSKVLFEARWGFSKANLSEEEYKSIIENKAKPALEKLKKQEEVLPIIECKAIYGFFLCETEGNRLNVLDSNNKTVIFDFPRQKQSPNLCITDFIQKHSDLKAIIPFFAVTLGNKIIEEEKRLFEENSYYNYHLLHGLGAEMADCGAQCIHKRIRDEYFQYFSEKENTGGCRYSFGYPSCPDLAYQKKLFELLGPSKIGLSLTESYQMVPELSVSGFIIFNKRAKYFSI